jgi:hypothetical protein
MKALLAAAALSLCALPATAAVTFDCKRPLIALVA